MSACPCQGVVELMNCDSCIINGLTGKNTTQVDDAGTMSKEPVAASKDNAEQYFGNSFINVNETHTEMTEQNITKMEEEERDLENVSYNSETESDTEVKGSLWNNALSCERNVECDNNVGVRLSEVNRDFPTEGDGQDVCSAVCHSDSIQPCTSGSTSTATNMETSYDKDQTTCTGNWPMLDGGITPCGRTSSVESSDDSQQQLCSRSNDVLQLEKSFSTSLNFFSTLSSPSCQSVSGHVTSLGVLIPLDSGVDGNQGDVHMSGYIQPPAYMDLTSNSSISDDRDIDLIGREDDDDDSVDLSVQCVTPSTNLNIGASLSSGVISDAPSVTVVTSVYAHYLSNTADLSEMTKHPSPPDRMFQDENQQESGDPSNQSAELGDSQHDKTKPYEMNKAIAENGEGEQMQEQNTYALPIAVQGGIVEEICVSWPLSSTNTSCVLGEPLKASSPVTISLTS